MRYIIFCKAAIKDVTKSVTLVPIEFVKQTRWFDVVHRTCKFYVVDVKDTTLLLLFPQFIKAKRLNCSGIQI